MSFEIIKNMEMPTTVRKSGRKGSKYLTTEMEDVLDQLDPKSGFTVPFIDGEDGASRQRSQMDWYVKRWAKENPLLIDGENPEDPKKEVVRKFSLGVLLPVKDGGKVLREGGIIIRRDA